MNFKHATLASSVIIALTACGGGGSDGGSSSSNINTSPILVTRDNGKQIASTGATGVQSVGEAGRENSDTGKDFLSSGVAPTADSLARLVLKKSPSLATRATQSDSADCDGGGSLKVTVVDRNDNQEMDSGDSVTAKFSKCVIGDSDGQFTVNGSGSMTVNNLSDNGASSNADITIEFNDLAITESKEVASIDGDMRMVASFENNTANFSISGNKMEVNDTEEYGLIKDYSMQQSWNEMTNIWNQTVNATIASTDMNGQVVITTQTPLQGTGDNYPDTGEMKFEGANGTYVSLNADTGDNSTVNMIIFDGSATISDEIPWSELED